MNNFNYCINMEDKYDVIMNKIHSCILGNIDIILQIKHMNIYSYYQ